MNRIDSSPNSLSYVLTDDEVIVSFELATYSVSEGQASAEVCAVTSATPIPGQSVSVLVSTEDGTALGMRFFFPIVLVPNASGSGKHYIEFSEPAIECALISKLEFFHSA